ncbi:MAG: CCA tRNA nucleotidyltransferase [Fibrobacter sp.]|nr:CCA tRNA nucleotidyltransferase [Fibrobacter sp.]
MAMVQTLAGEFFEPELPRRLLKIAADIVDAGGRAYLVGGWVRDALLGKNCRDYDVEVYDLTQDQLLPILSKYGKTNLVGKAFGVIHLSMKGESLDFSFPRTESKVGYGHKGFVVHTDAKLSFREAALRRDFTINAMGMELPDLRLCDPYGGIEDLKNSCLRHVGPAFAEDSLRILRGVQFASRFALNLAPETVEICRTLSLDDLSMERLFEEFKKWLLKPGKPSLGLKAFLQIGLDEYFPQVQPMGGSSRDEGWIILGQLLDGVANNRNGLTDEESSELAFAALLSGNALPGCPCGDVREVARKFLARITNEIHLDRKVPEILKCYGELDFETVPTAPTLRRLAVRLDSLKLLALLVKCTPASLFKKPSFADDFWQAASGLDLLDAAPQPYLTGKMLLDLGVKPGKQMGEIIKKSFELQLDGVLTDAVSAVAWADRFLSPRP